MTNPGGVLARGVLVALFASLASCGTTTWQSAREDVGDLSLIHI